MTAMGIETMRFTTTAQLVCALFQQLDTRGVNCSSWIRYHQSTGSPEPSIHCVPRMSLGLQRGRRHGFFTP